MFKAKGVLKLGMVVLIWFAFLGQSMALSIVTPCDFSLENEPHSATEQAEHKELTAIDGDSSAHCCDLDCCEIDCICSPSACSSIAYLPSVFDLTNTYFKPLVIFNPSSVQTSAFASMLYRPPIFACN